MGRWDWGILFYWQREIKSSIRLSTSPSGNLGFLYPFHVWFRSIKKDLCITIKLHIRFKNELQWLHLSNPSKEAPVMNTAWHKELTIFPCHGWLWREILQKRRCWSSNLYTRSKISNHNWLDRLPLLWNHTHMELKNGIVTLSMPGYVTKCLRRFKHIS